MSDVARAAHVSSATVSYALRGDSRISHETTDKVRRAAQKLHYTTNLSARSLRSGRNGIIGVAIFELDHPYPAQMSAAMSHEAARHGYGTIVQETSDSKENEIAFLRRVTIQLTEGTIFSPGHITDREIQHLTGDKPLVLLDDISAHPTFDSVATPGFEGSRTAIGHLLDVGCRRILIIGAPYQKQMLSPAAIPLTVSQTRFRGCVEAFRQHGMQTDPHQFVATDHWDSQNARAAAHHLVDAGVQFDGAYCLTDTLAIGFIRGLADRGVRVPGDVKVIGFDGINEGEDYIPSLTTIKTDMGDLAHKAVSLLISKINSPTRETTDKTAARTLTAKFSLVCRESTQS